MGKLRWLMIPANAAATINNITTVQSDGEFLMLYPSNAVQPLVANSNYGIPASALAVVGNATVVNTNGGFLTLWPSNADRPNCGYVEFQRGPGC